MGFWLLQQGFKYINTGLMRIHSFAGLIEMDVEEARNIQVVDAPELNSFDLSKINNALAATYDKLHRIVDNEMLLALHFKEYNTAGRREKFSIHLHLDFPGKRIVAKAVGWDAVSTVQKALRKLERETIETVKRKK